MDNEQTDQVLDLMGVMLSSYPSQGGQDSNAALRGYLMAIDGCSFEAVAQVLHHVIAGKQTGFDRKFTPSSGQLGEWCRNADDMLRRTSLTTKPREHGILKLNFGGRDIDTSEMTLAQVNELMATSGRSLDRIGFAGGSQSLGGVLQSIEAVHGRPRFDVGDPEGSEDAA